MLVSLINADISLLSVIWIVACSFFTISILLCCGLTLRRLKRNKRNARRIEETETLHRYVTQAIQTKMSPEEAVSQMPTQSTSVITDVLLHYFRTLKGDALEQLQTVICESTLESVLAQETKNGIHGRRTRALKILSYLPSQSSLPIIFEQLSSENKYVRLTAARGLVRRKALYGMEAIIDSYLEAFPNNTRLLTTLMKDFGPDAIPHLETLIETSESKVVMAAALEALEFLMPAHTSLDLMQLVKNPDERVRAGALALSAVTSHKGSGDIIRQGLQDSSIKVKIKAAKIAHDSKRSDIVSDLYTLSSDPLIWVRYWALKAI